MNPTTLHGSLWNYSAVIVKGEMKRETIGWAKISGIEREISDLGFIRKYQLREEGDYTFVYLVMSIAITHK